MAETPEMNDSGSKKTEPEYGLFDLISIGFQDLGKLLQDIKFASIILIILAITTMIGTALPQISMSGEDAAIQLAEKFGQGTYDNFIKPLGFDRVFKTPWYKFLILLLVASVTLCAWARTKTAIALGKSRSPVATENAVKALKFSGEQKFDSKEDAVGWVTKEVAAKGFKLASEEQEETVYYLGKKNLTSKWMLVAMHYSFVIILLGAIIGAMGGKKDQAFIKEGEVWSTKDKKATVKLIDYWMEFDQKDFPDEMSLFKGGMPSDFVSKVEALDATGKVIKEMDVEVNQPLKTGGYTFYQTAWDYEPIFSVYLNGEKLDRFPVKRDTPFRLGETNKALFVPFRQILSGYKIVKNPDGTKTREELPPQCMLYQMNIDETGKGDTDIQPVEAAGNGTGIFKLGDKITFAINGDNYELRFEGMQEYTVLEVKRDPGVPIVFFGFFLLFIGATWGLMLPYGMARAIIKKKGKNWFVVWGATIPAISEK